MLKYYFLVSSYNFLYFVYCSACYMLENLKLYCQLTLFFCIKTIRFRPIVCGPYISISIVSLPIISTLIVHEYLPDRKVTATTCLGLVVRTSTPWISTEIFRLNGKTGRVRILLRCWRTDSLRRLLL